MSEALVVERIAELKKFYEAHNPEKVGDAETIIRGYPFDSIVASLEAKYGSALIEAELPSWFAVIKQNAEREARERLERTSIDDFNALKTQLADMEACLADGGADAVRSKHGETASLTDEQVKLAINNLKGLVALAATTEVGSKAEETIEITCNIEIPEGQAPGSMFSINLPNKTAVNIEVPEGVEPGQTISLKIPVPKSDESIFKAAAESSEGN